MNEQKEMKKKLAVIIAILIVIAIVIGITVSNLRFRGDLTEISSEKQLQKIVDGYTEILMMKYNYPTDKFELVINEKEVEDIIDKMTESV